MFSPRLLLISILMALRSIFFFTLIVAKKKNPHDVTGKIVIVTTLNDAGSSLWIKACYFICSWDKMIKTNRMETKT